MITMDGAGAGASHDLIAHLDKLAARPGYQVIYSAGWMLAGREKAALRLIPEQAWQIAIDGHGEVRERRADDACADIRCAHRACWVEEAHVTELTGLLREGPDGDQERTALGPVEPQPPGPPAGKWPYPGTKIQVQTRSRGQSAPAVNPDVGSGTGAVAH